MVSDQDIAKSVETLLRQSDPNAITTLNGVVHQLEANLGLDLSHKAGFIRDQINLLLRPKGPPKDHFALPHYQQFQNCHPQFHNPHFALQQLHQQQQQQQHFQQVQLRQQQVQPLPAPVPPPQVVRAETNVKKEAPNSSEVKKESAPAGTKRRGGPGGLNKVCGVSPELQVIVGEPALARTEIVKQLWAYIRKNNLQDPSNKRKIICDDALRLVFETDCTDMFKMNKLLAKHIIRLEPTKETSRSKKLKVDVEPATESAESGPPAPHSGPSAPHSSPPAPHSSLPAPHSSPPAVIISEALANFFGTGEREMLQSEALGRVWEYIKVNHLEDPMNSMVILCDAKLRELFGCESISALGISEILARHHLYRR